MKKTGLLYYSMEKVKEIGINKTIDEALKFIDPNNKKMIHLSLDVDGLDPSLIPGTGTTAPNGLNIEDYKVIIDRIREAGNRFSSMDLVEVNFDIEKEITLETVKKVLKLTFN